MKNYFDLTGRVAIVTGCSTGLGVQMARALASQGCTIVPIARRLDKLQEVAKEISEEFGVEAYPIRCDITSTEMVEQIINQKWAVNVHGNPIESWFDINRTGYPTVGKTISYSPGVSDGFPKRFLIPNSSTEYNSNAPAGKSLTDKMWWQK